MPTAEQPPTPSDAQLLFAANRLLLLTHSGQFPSRDLHARALAVLELVHASSPEHTQAVQLKHSIAAAYTQNGGKPPAPDYSAPPEDLVRALQGPMPVPSRQSNGDSGEVAQTAPGAAAAVVGQQVAAPPSTAPGCEENGSCYGDTSAATGLPKTVEVHGYYRHNGTYVRGHYRSK